MARVIVLDSIANEGLALLEQNPDIEYQVQTGLSGDALREALTEFDGAICRSGVKILAESLAGNRRLRGIVRAGVGTDNIDKTAATRQGIVVMNTPSGNTLSTAEHAFALMLGLSRNIAPASETNCSPGPSLTKAELNAPFSSISTSIMYVQNVEGLVKHGS